MRTRANAIIVGLALVVLIVVGGAVATAQRTPPAAYDSASAAPSGTLALYRWIAALGYTPRRLTAGPLRSDNLSGLGVLIVLQPRQDFSPAEADAALRWAHGGGTLVLLEDENGGETTLLGRLGLRVDPLGASVDPATLASGTVPYGAAPVQPLLLRPSLRGLDTTVTAGVTGGAPGVIPVLGAGGLRYPGAPAHARVLPPDASTPALVYERWGRGRVYAGSTPGMLTNGRIAAGDNRRLVPNLLAGLPAGAAVGLDDYHLVPHTATQQPLTLNDVLAVTAWGRALLYALALVFLYIVLTGRRLGRPLRPVPERGRSLAEYVISMAAIFRRAGLRVRVLDLWQGSLRRTLAGPGGLRGRADAEVVAEAARRANLTPEESNEALTLLRARPALNERGLVELCRRIARLQQRLSQGLALKDHGRDGP